MNEDANLIGLKTKQPVRFDHFGPLFIRVAESMVIFAPMSAWDGAKRLIQWPNASRRDSSYETVRLKQ